MSNHINVNAPAKTVVFVKLPALTEIRAVDTDRTP